MAYTLTDVNEANQLLEYLGLAMTKNWNAALVENLTAQEYSTTYKNLVYALRRIHRIAPVGVVESNTSAIKINSKINRPEAWNALKEHGSILIVGPDIGKLVLVLDHQPLSTEGLSDPVVETEPKEELVEDKPETLPTLLKKLNDLVSTTDKENKALLKRAEAAESRVAELEVMLEEKETTLLELTKKQELTNILSWR